MAKEHHRKKMVAPIVITILFLAILAGYGTIYFMIDLPIWHMVSLPLVCLTGFEPATFGVGVIRHDCKTPDLCGFRDSLKITKTF